MDTLISRMIRAAKLDANLYEEVEADSSALGQAILVVVLSSLAGGIGAISVQGLGGVFVGVIVALAGWFFWALLVYFIGTKLLPQPQTKSDVGELLRTIGFSAAPGIIRIVGIIPFLFGIVNFIASIWMLVAMIVAVRQALDYDSTLRAVIVCVIGWLISIFIAFLLGAPSFSSI
jgi:hypothetical protein